MVFAVVFLANAVANFVLGIALSALLGPAEFGRFATVALGATTLAIAAFDWLRLSSIRFSGAYEDRAATAASLDAGYVAMVCAAVACVVALLAAGIDFGLGGSLLALTPFMAIAYARSDYFAAWMRARDRGRAFAALAVTRHALTFTIVIAVAAASRSASSVIAALTATTLVSVVALGPATRTPDARLALANWRSIKRFARYSKPIVASTAIYLMINLIDRHLALERFGAAATGQLALATDLGLRMFLAINVLPETLLFQYALKRERDEGSAAAERQVAANIVLSFAVLAPLTASYMAMAPTIEAVIAPPAFRGEFARLSILLAPGFLAFCALSSMCYPVFQLAKKTWPLTLAAVAALIVNLVLVYSPFFSADIEGLAEAFAISLGVGFAVAAYATFRMSAVRLPSRDMIVVCATACAMGLAMRPLNAIHPPLLAALMSFALGGAILAGSILAFDVGGLRALAVERLPWPARRPGFDTRGGGYVDADSEPHS